MKSYFSGPGIPSGAEPHFLVCSIVSEAIPVDGSWADKCRDCGSRVSVAPSSQTALDQGAVIICMFCARTRIEKAPDDEPITIQEARDLKP